jgi:hypothetical protein
MCKMAKLALSGLFLIAVGLTGCESPGLRNRSTQTASAASSTATSGTAQPKAWSANPIGTAGLPAADSSQLSTQPQDSSGVQRTSSTGASCALGSFNSTGSSGSSATNLGGGSALTRDPSSPPQSPSLPVTAAPGQ